MPNTRGSWLLLPIKQDIQSAGAVQLYITPNLGILPCSTQPHPRSTSRRAKQKQARIILRFNFIKTRTANKNPSKTSKSSNKQRAIMSKNIVNTHQYPFKFEDPVAFTDANNRPGAARDVNVALPNVRGRITSIQASRLRTMMLEAHQDPNKILAHCCSMNGLSSRLVEEAGFPMVFLAGYACASSYG